MGFNTYSLNDVCLKITDGSHFSPPDDADSPIPMLSVKDMAEYDFKYDNCKHVSRSIFEQLKRNDCVPQKGDILVAKDGSYLKEIFVNKETTEKAVLSSIAIFRPNTAIVVPEFLCYLLKSPRVLQYTKDNCVSGSALPRIILKAFKGIKLEIPDLETQKKIVHILSAIDDRIESNTQTNRFLAEESQLLFDDYVKNNDLKYHKISSFNPILETGKRPSGGIGNIRDGIPSVGAESIKGIGYFDYAKTKYVSVDFFKKMKKGIVHGYELLIYKDGGKPGYFIPNFSMFGEGFPYEECAINEHVFLLDFKEIRLNIFAYYFFNSAKTRHRLHVLGSKTAAIPGINQQDILNLEIPLLDRMSKNTLDLLVLNTKKVLFNSKQNHTLSAIRDTLLPRLVDGSIDIDGVTV